ncbi:MAG: Ppx/GppA phosphatase family protein [Thermoanaerobaculia bacterium]
MSRFLVLEFGSKSLKVHRRSENGQFEKATIAWTLGHEVYRDGRISTSTRERVAKVLAALVARGFRREGMLAIATGAVRDAPDREEFIQFLRQEQKLGVRVLSGREEASLLAQGFLEASGERPALVADIGGGSLEMVYLGADRTALRDSLPLGAIRLHYLGAEPGGRFARPLVSEYIESTLREASVMEIPRIHATGGPVKAIARALGRDRLGRDDLLRLEEQVARDGPPDGLSVERRRIFLPGLMALRRLIEHCRAEYLHYLSIPIGRIFLERFLGQVREGLQTKLNVELLQGMRLTQLHCPEPARDAEREAGSKSPRP